MNVIWCLYLTVVSNSTNYVIFDDTVIPSPSPQPLYDPQALKISIPGIVNTFIGLYKDTTLVIIIGLLDPLGIGRASLSDAVWAGLAKEVYLFVAIFFFICCFAMSRYSLWLEKRLSTEN